MTIQTQIAQLQALTDIALILCTVWAPLYLLSQRPKPAPTAKPPAPEPLNREPVTRYRAETLTPATESLTLHETYLGASAWGEGAYKPGPNPDALALKTVIQLRSMCRDRGLKVSGSKAELVARLSD